MKPKAIARLRKNLTMSQSEFSNLFGVHYITVSRWETGHTKPTPYQSSLLRLFKIAYEKQSNVGLNSKQLIYELGAPSALFYLLDIAIGNLVRTYL